MVRSKVLSPPFIAQIRQPGGRVITGRKGKTSTRYRLNISELALTLGVLPPKLLISLYVLVHASV